ncbi:MAG: hydroxyacid dehydrogenase [Robiginitomaculum sp.]|nr:MAG: hydroxyacid dehydrogenase [Robiginitomaculum sp.]
MVELPTAFIDKARAILGPKGLAQDPVQLAPFLTEWRDRWRGSTPLLAQPDNPKKLAEFVNLCATYKLPITPQGGNTGLVGGQIPQGEVLLSTRRLTQIRAIDPAAMTLCVDAGVTLQQAAEAAAEHDLLFPLELASGGSATIGGAIATNAGGMGVLRYGNMRDLVLGLEVVLPDGQLWDGLSTLRKDNTGYDLKQLFIGSEGTLGVVTGATLRLFARPPTQITIWAGLEQPEDAVKLLAHLRGGFAEQISKFELISETSLELVLAHMNDARRPLQSRTPWHVLVEFGLSDTQDAMDQVFFALESAMEQGSISDAIVAKSQAEANALLALRENISAAQKQQGAAIKHDISLPLAAIPDFLQAAAEAIELQAPGTRFCIFGHLGDGNLHYNLLQPVGMKPQDFLAQRETITGLVHDLVHARAGSFSAEHGIGIAKIGEMQRYKSPMELSLMQSLKQTFDPDHLMNPRLWFEIAPQDKKDV